jgi:hypothetical protein
VVDNRYVYMAIRLAMKKMEHLTIRQAVKWVFKGLMSTGPFFAWIKQGLFRPSKYVPESEAARGRGCELNLSDLVAMAVLQAMFASGVRFDSIKGAIRDVPGSRIIIDDYGLSEKEKERLQLATEEGRGLQAFLELKNYSVIVWCFFRYINVPTTLPKALKLVSTVFACERGIDPANDNRFRILVRGELEAFVTVIDAAIWKTFVEARLEANDVVLR